MKSFKLILLATFILSITACSAFLIPETNDPQKKLEWAYAALSSSRPLPAIKLTNEAIQIYENQDNKLMLAVSHNIYGLIAHSFPGIGDLEKNEAIEHYEKSLNYFDDIYVKVDFDDEENIKTIQHATNSAFNLAEIYQQNGNNEISCKYLEVSKYYYNLQVEVTNEPKVQSPGHNSFDEAVKSIAVKANCK